MIGTDALLLGPGVYSIGLAVLLSTGVCVGASKQSKRLAACSLGFVCFMAVEDSPFLQGRKVLLRFQKYFCTGLLQAPKIFVCVKIFVEFWFNRWRILLFVFLIQLIPAYVEASNILQISSRVELIFCKYL
jgi:hypothetical protein